MKTSTIVLALLVQLSVALAATDLPKRPPVVGISHIALYVHDIEQSRKFYKEFLGFDEPYSLNNDDGSLKLTWIKINDQQSIELFSEKEAGSDRLYHIALETTDAAAMRDYLAANGVKVPDTVPKGKIGNLNYFLTDPDGHFCEIVQYAPDGWTMQNKGKFMADTRISTHMPHVGILVGDLGAAQKFYNEILGCRESWRGAKKPEVLSWVHSMLPDSDDFIEFMLYSELPEPSARGRFHHLCLQVPDLEKAKAILQERAAKIGYDKPMEIQTGVNRKRQLNLYDPDGTRVELMEPRTVDGVAAPPSTAPPPQPAKPPATTTSAR
jgi:catechol 2,3-dioxygenase-like lactoylglutathione lyase family enzyme